MSGGDSAQPQHNVAWALRASMDAGRYADRVAYVGDDGLVVTHRAIHERSAHAAAALRRLGIESGDRVALRAYDSVSWVVAFLACARLGALVAIVSTDLADDSVDELYRHFQPQVILSDCDERGLAPEALEEPVGDAELEPPTPVSRDTPLYVQYTSGTTGAPKGAVHTHAHVMHYASAFGRDVLGLDLDDVCLSASRMFFAYGFVNSVVLPLASGARAVVSRARPSSGEIAARCREHRVTVLFAVPSLYARLVSDFEDQAFHQVRVGVSGGERLQLATRAAASGLLGAPILDCLGSTEMGYTYCANRLTDIVPGTVGRPLQGYELELRQSGEPIAADGVEGDVWVRGPSMMQGYLDAPELSAGVLRDGWLWTKDRAVLDGGNVAVLGRADDVEIVKGVNVNPLEIEAVLADCEGVSEVAVVGRVDEEGVTRLHAYVVPTGTDVGSLAARVTALATTAFAQETVKIPRVVVLVDSLPRTATGKLQRFALRNERRTPR